MAGIGPCVCLLLSLVGSAGPARRLSIRIASVFVSARLAMNHGGWAWLCEMSRSGVCSRVFPWLDWQLIQSARLRACVRVNTARPRVARVLACARKNAAAAELASP